MADRLAAVVNGSGVRGSGGCRCLRGRPRRRRGGGVRLRSGGGLGQLDRERAGAGERAQPDDRRQRADAPVQHVTRTGTAVPMRVPVQVRHPLGIAHAGTTDNETRPVLAASLRSRTHNPQGRQDLFPCREPEKTGHIGGMSSATDFDVAAFLRARQHEILSTAASALGRARLAHYDTAPAEERLGSLLRVLIASCGARRVDVALSYAECIAVERQSDGVALVELQTAINVLEETLWRVIVRDAPPPVQPAALGMVSTILGAAKDRAACSYVDRSVLGAVCFDGTDVDLGTVVA
jgi:hypothetical protein